MRSRPERFRPTRRRSTRTPRSTTQWILDQQSLKRRGTPEDIGNLVVFLAGDASSFITGQTIEIDGGWAMH